MDLTVNNTSSYQNTFGARLSWKTRRAIKRGIRSEVREIAQHGKNISKIRLKDRKNMYKKILSAVDKIGDGTFSLYNELGLSSKVTKIDFSGPYGYKAFNLPEDIQNEIKLVDASNIFTNKYKIKEFPAKRLGWLYNFFQNVKV